MKRKQQWIFKKSVYFIYLVGLITWTTASVASAQTRLQIVSNDQQPLANAVVEVELKYPMPLSSNNQSVYIMDQIKKAFEPRVLIIPKDSLVKFPNSDEVRHHVYSFSNAKPFELKLYSGKPKEPIPFEKQGVVVLGCNIHDSMVGYIYVTENSQTYKSNSKGIIELKVPKQDIVALTLWHPNAQKGVKFRKHYKQQALINQADIVTLHIAVNPPAPTGSFEDQFYNVQ